MKSIFKFLISSQSIFWAIFQTFISRNAHIAPSSILKNHSKIYLCAKII